MTQTHIITTCAQCDRDQHWDCDPPEYDVGLMGWVCYLSDQYHGAGDCQCTFSDVEIKALALYASETASEPPEPWYDERW